MNTTYDNKNIETEINQTEADALSLADFNRMHSDTILRTAEAKRAHRNRIMTDKAFEVGSFVLFVATATAGGWSLLTMIAR